MTYQETIDYLYQQLPVFQNVGGAAYKPGLERVERLLDLCHNPHKGLTTIHVAGTNGKGSTSSMIAAVLQSAGYRVGLFTSPHLVDFRERIRINGEMIPEEEVVDFVDYMLPRVPEDLQPSFFEMTTAMAFSFFAKRETDICVIEVGMGGRLDSTNVIKPLVSVITSVSIDHAAFLGDTLGKIAYEKAGIIKDHVPVVLARSKEEEVTDVVKEIAASHDADLYMADRNPIIVGYRETLTPMPGYELTTHLFGPLFLALTGDYQLENANAVLRVCALLRDKYEMEKITPAVINDGLTNVARTGLRGRLELYKEGDPAIYLDTGHNEGAWDYLSKILAKWADQDGLVCVLGFAKDKDVNKVVHLLPKNAFFIFTKAAGDRSMDANDLWTTTQTEGLKGIACDHVRDAYDLAIQKAREQGYKKVFIGGSNFVVGDLLSHL